jgi:hypothetical protein
MVEIGEYKPMCYPKRPNCHQPCWPKPPRRPPQSLPSPTARLQVSSNWHQPPSSHGHELMAKCGFKVREAELVTGGEELARLHSPAGEYELIGHLAKISIIPSSGSQCTSPASGDRLTRRTTSCPWLAIGRFPCNRPAHASGGHFAARLKLSDFPRKFHVSTVDLAHLDASAVDQIATTV